MIVNSRYFAGVKCGRVHAAAPGTLIIRNIKYLIHTYMERIGFADLDELVHQRLGVGSVLLMEGAGVPRITVRAWNRQVDWPQMVANLGAISSGESVRIGDAPQP